MFGINYLLALQKFRETTKNLFDGFFLYVTELGEVFVLILFIACIYWCIDKKTGTFFMLSFNINFLINAFAKTFFAVYRPWIKDPRVQPLKNAFATATGYSFPSGHTMNATSVFGAVAWNQRKNKAIAAFAIALCLFIGFSRNYVGVHTPQDVVVGLLLSIIVIYCAERLMHLLDKKPNIDILILCGGLLLNILLIVYCSVKNYHLDYDAAGKLLVDPTKMVRNSYLTAGAGFGFFIGWFIERRFIKFEVPTTWQKKVVRFLIGAAVIAILYKFAYSAFRFWFGKQWGGAISQFINFLFVMIYPVFFKKSK